MSNTLERDASAKAGKLPPFVGALNRRVSQSPLDGAFAPGEMPPPGGENAELSLPEVAGTAFTTLPPPSAVVEAAPATSEDFQEAGPEIGGATETTFEASPETLATALQAEAGEESAASDLVSEGYEVSTSPAAEAFLPEASAGTPGTAQQEFAFLAPLVSMLVSSVGPILIKAVSARLSSKAKKVLSAIAKTAARPARKEAGAEFNITSILPLVAQLFEAAELQANNGAGAVGDALGAGDEAAGEEGVNEAVITEAVATIEAIVDYDDRIRITNTTAIPWRRYCALRIEFPSGSMFRGTGFFIGPRAVATAGHCVYMRDQGGWARRIEVIPGCNGAARPYDSATATVFRSTTGWVKSGLPAADYGCIFVPAGSFGGQNIGSFGVAAFDAATLLAQPAVVAGYPGDRPFGELWGASRLIKTVSDSTIGYRTATAPGESGAPVVIKRNGQRFVVGIHNYGARSGNSATRVTVPVLQRLSAWAKA